MYSVWTIQCFINPSIHFQYLPLLELPAAIGWKQGDTLDKWPLRHMPHRANNRQFSCNFTWHGWGRKLENQCRPRLGTVFILQYCIWPSNIFNDCWLLKPNDWCWPIIWCYFMPVKLLIKILIWPVARLQTEKVTSQKKNPSPSIRWFSFKMN